MVANGLREALVAAAEGLFDEGEATAGRDVGQVGVTFEQGAHAGFVASGSGGDLLSLLEGAGGSVCVVEDLLGERLADRQTKVRGTEQALLTAARAW
jgi:hypothetical protein